MDKKKVTTVVLFTVLFLLLLPITQVRAEVEETAPEQTITYEGETYTLYKVEKIPSVSMYSEEENDGIRVEREITAYYYRSVEASEIVKGEAYDTVFTADGTKIVVMKQETEWRFYEGSRTELISADSFLTYRYGQTVVYMRDDYLYHDMDRNAIYTQPYTVLYLANVYEREIATECTIYGEVYRVLP